MVNARELLAQLEGCFDPGELDVLISAAPASGREQALVKVIHKPSGREFLGEAETQIKSKVSALLALLSAALPELPHGDSRLHGLKTDT